MLFDLGAIVRIDDQAHLFNAAVKRFLNDDLNGRLADAVPIHNGQHLFLNGGGGGVHPRTLCPAAVMTAFRILFTLFLHEQN